MQGLILKLVLGALLTVGSISYFINLIKKVERLEGENHGLQEQAQEAKADLNRVKEVSLIQEDVLVQNARHIQELNHAYSTVATELVKTVNDGCLDTPVPDAVFGIMYSYPGEGGGSKGVQTTPEPN